MRCDYIAEGVIKATKDLSMTIPLVVRLKGTKEAEAKESVQNLFSSCESLLTVFCQTDQELWSQNLCV